MSTPERLLAASSASLGQQTLDALLEQHGPGAPAWLTRVHRHLAQQWPDAFVFHLRHPMESVTRWLDSVGTERREDSLLFSMAFDDDRDAPRDRPEGGSLVFNWNDHQYRTVTLKARGERRDEIHTWVVCPAREAAEQLVDAVGRFRLGQRETVMVFQDGDWEAAPRLALSLSHYDWESLVLPEAEKERLRGAAERFFCSEGVYRELGIPWKLGFLLVGPPGTGKTLTTKILANTCGVPFLYVRGLHGFCDSKPDSSTVRWMFQGVRERAPCLLCLEDLDALVTDDVRSAFLNEMDGLDEDYRGVLTVATTNHPERLDAALLQRPSRFDYRFELPLPDEEQRRAFVAAWVARLSALGYVENPAESVDEIVRHSRGMSHAYLKRVLVGVALRMQNQQERGDDAFARLAREEIADAAGDRSLARRSEAGTRDQPGTKRVGFRSEPGA